MSSRRQEKRLGKAFRKDQATSAFGGPSAMSSPFGKFFGAEQKAARKSWTFERLEDRQMMAVTLNDPYFNFQWPLLNTGGVNIGDQLLQDITGTPGEDINVVPAWDLGYTGSGVRVAIVSTGIQTNHPDLAANISPLFGYDVQTGLDKLFDPGAGEAILSFPADAIGTALAGIVGAVGNNGEGVVGVAYNSELVPVTLLNGVDFGQNVVSDLTTPQAIRDLFLWENQNVDVYLHGWGPDDSLSQIDGPTVGEFDALRFSVEQGRGGLGNIHIFPAGDGAGLGVGAFTGPTQLTSSDFAGYNGYVNSRYTIGVTSVDHDGEVSNDDGTITRFGEIGPSVLVAAPSGSFSGFGVVDDTSVGTGIWTTDFAPNLQNPLSNLLQGYNAPTDPILGNEPNDLIIDPFSGLTLNDRFTDAAYTSRGATGTQVAAAHVAGVVALMLEADREANGGVSTLSYRDVQEILVRSARQNAQFEKLQTGLEKGLEIEHPETWVVNRDEIWHDPDTWDPSTVDVFQEVDGTDFQTQAGIFGGPVNFPNHGGLGGIVFPGALAHIYHPLIDPSDFFNTWGGPEWSPVSLYTNGAGYTVSQGRTFQGSSVGYGHGVVDAELAVKLAAQWNAKDQNLADEVTFTTSALPPFGNNLPPVAIGDNDAIGTVIVPGRLGGGDFIGFFNEYGADDPFDDGTPIFTQGVEVPITVAPGNDMSIEWVSAKLELTSGEIDNLRITLISPNGVHSELNHYFDTRDGTEYHQHLNDTVNVDTGAAPENLGGDGPGGPGDADGGGIFYTFTSNRHWGERSNDVLAIDPATGEPYENSLGFFGSEPVQRGWSLLFENYGPEGMALGSFEVSFHGTPIEANTQRIQGFVGIDENEDGVFNFDRYFQSYVDIFPRESLLNDAALRELEMLQGLPPLSLGSGIDFKRLGELERFADEAQEQFADNVTVELWARTQEDVDNGVDGVKIDEFITGDDGNYYFDVNPLSDFSSDPNAFNIDFAFYGGLTDSQKEIFQEAADKWESIIVGDLPDVVGTYGALIDDLLITASGVEIDGVGSILGQARPTQFREDGTFLPSAGLMEFDLADVDALEASGELLDVIIHEMGHVLGIGTIWDARGFIAGTGTETPTFVGTEAVAAYNELFQTNAAGVPIQPAVEAHWDEAVFGNELMTPFIGPGTVNPISIVTVAMLKDLGYAVNENGADPYTPPELAPLLTGGSGGGIDTSSAMLQIESEMVFATAAPAGAASAAMGNNNYVEYVVKAVDGEGRDRAGNFGNDPNTPDGFLAKYKREWTITADYFSAWDHEGRAPDYERDAMGNYLLDVNDEVIIFPVDEDGMVIVDEPGPPMLFSPANLVGGNVFNPSTDYDIPVDANGNPIPYQSLAGPLRDSVRGINFLFNPLAELTDPESITVNVSGFVYSDEAGDGLFNNGDVTLGNVTVYVDSNFDGALTPGETAIQTSAEDGSYSFQFETRTPTAIRIGVVVPTGFELHEIDPGFRGAIISPGDADITNFDFNLIPFENGGGGNGGNGGNGGGSETPGRIQGVVYQDTNGDGVRQSAEFGIEGIRVYFDFDNDFVFTDGVDPSTFTNQFGVYDLSNVTPGDVSLRVVADVPYGQVTPGGTGSHFFVLEPDEFVRGRNFGLENLAIRDFGDLMGFPTLFGENGASHVIKAGLRLGALIDGELDGQPNMLATGDEVNLNSNFNLPQNDEDGVTLIDASGDGEIQAGEALTFRFEVVGTGQSINAWIDWNGNGSWLDPGDHFIQNFAVNHGINNFFVTAPAGVTTTEAIGARFRLGGAGLNFFGPAATGEVEDYLYNQSALAVLGDSNGDGSVNTLDIDAFVQALANPAQYIVDHPGVPYLATNDINGDGFVNTLDIDAFVSLLTGGVAASATEGPATLAFQQQTQQQQEFAAHQAQAIQTPLATFTFESALASVGLVEQVAEDGSSTELINVAGAALLPGAAELIEAIGAEPVAVSTGESELIAEFEQAELQLAFELNGLPEEEEESAFFSSLTGEEARIDEEEDPNALADAFEDDLFVV